jgi:hypothetical protein
MVLMLAALVIFFALDSLLAWALPRGQAVRPER